MRQPIRTPARTLRLLVAGILVLLSGCGLVRRPERPIDRSQDPRIQREVEARLADEPALQSAAIRVEVEGGIVMLHGSVPGLAAWQCAITNAELVRGVKTVVAYLVIESGPREIRCLAPRAPTDTITGR